MSDQFPVGQRSAKHPVFGRYDAQAIKDSLSEAIWECEREPRTSLWFSFWDRLTEGGSIPDMPTGDETHDPK